MGGNISRDPPTGSRKKSGLRNNSTTASTITTAATTASANTEEKKVMIQKPTKRTIYGRTYHANEDSTYMLPRDDKEIDRLHEEHFITKELLGLYVVINSDYFNQNLFSTIFFFSI